MNDELLELLKKHVDHKAILYTNKNFRYECFIKNVGNEVIEIDDLRNNCIKVILLNTILEADFF